MEIDALPYPPYNLSRVKQSIVSSPYKVQKLPPDLKISKPSGCGLYAPWSNLGFCTLDNLDFYTTLVQLETLLLSRKLTLKLNSIVRAAIPQIVCRACRDV